MKRSLGNSRKGSVKNHRNLLRFQHLMIPKRCELQGHQGEKNDKEVNRDKMMMII
jgi:hypothetical protein